MKRSIIPVAGAALLAAFVAFASSSCNTVYDDDLQPCPTGVSLHFVYDYNMEYANAFPAKVDCVTLYVFDGEGKHVTTCTETTDVLSREDYRMQIDLEEGDYRFIAYGGLACQAHSFAVGQEPQPGTHWSELSVEMVHDNLTSAQKLHDFYYGTAEGKVEVNAYKEVTLRLMKNTNNIRVVLQQVNGKPLSDEDFTFAVTDDNTSFDSSNNLTPNGTATYLPWSQGCQSVGENEGEVTVAYAEFSTSRLVKEESHRPRLSIRRASDGENIIDIPLIDYLLLLKSDAYSEMGEQEFLDRESEWSLIFFLDDRGEWLKTQIVVNGWVVRLNGMVIEF